MADLQFIPNRIWFSLTGLCNNSCKWCLRRGSEIPVFLEPALILRFAKIFAEAGVRHCSIFGGEPTLHKDFRKIVNGLIRDGLFKSCTFITNGRLFSDSVPEEWFGNKKVFVTVSLHGANQDHYRANTGSNEGFGEAMRAIENLKRNKIRHSVNIVVSHENLKMMPDFIRILSGLADRLGFTFALPPLDDVGYHSDPYVLSESVASINSLCLEYKQDHCFVYSLPWCTLKKDLLDNLLSRNELMFNCPVNKGKVVVVKENCTLSLCTHLSGVELLGREETQEVLSSSKTFLGFWNSAEMNKIRRSMDVYRHPKCVLCEHRFFCKGGCPLWWGFSDFQKTFTAT